MFVLGLTIQLFVLGLTIVLFALGLTIILFVLGLTILLPRRKLCKATYFSMPNYAQKQQMFHSRRLKITLYKTLEKPDFHYPLPATCPEILVPKVSIGIFSFCFAVAPKLSNPIFC